MGCTSDREKIEDQMMQIKLNRMEIQMERENKINQLSQMDGRKIKYKNIPDYIDQKFAIEKKIYSGNIDELTEELSKEKKENIKKVKKLKKKTKNNKKGNN